MLPGPGAGSVVLSVLTAAGGVQPPHSVPLAVLLCCDALVSPSAGSLTFLCMISWIYLFLPFPLPVRVTAAHSNLYFRVNDVNLIVSVSRTILMNK